MWLVLLLVLYHILHSLYGDGDIQEQNANTDKVALLGLLSVFKHNTDR